jgi:hypothetical protein
MFAPLMVLLKIDTAGFAVLEFEGDAPRSIDVDGIALWIESLQGMKVEAWNVHFFGSDSDVETIQPRENAFVHLRIDLRTPALGPKLRKGLAFESSDHEPT